MGIKDYLKTRSWQMGVIVIVLVFSVSNPFTTYAAGNITASGGGQYAVGDEFEIKVVASGVEFNALEGKISVSGPVDVVSFEAGTSDVYWISQPKEGQKFVGAFMGPARSSYQIAAIKLKGTGEGVGNVVVGDVRLVNAGKIVGTKGVEASFTIGEVDPDTNQDVPEKVEVSSSTHPKESQTYNRDDVSLEWGKKSGVIGFSYVFDQKKDTVPPSSIKSDETKVDFNDIAEGTYYFHVKAKNNAGWGEVTHFKINISDQDLCDVAVSNLKVNKNESFTSDVENGQVYGLAISGETEGNNVVKVLLNPEPVLPRMRSFETESNDGGSFEYLIDYPIKTGFYKLNAQVQEEGTLSCPLSDEIHFEVSLNEEGLRVIGESTSDEEDSDDSEKLEVSDDESTDDGEEDVKEDKLETKGSSSWSLPIYSIVFFVIIGTGYLVYRFLRKKVRRYLKKRKNRKK